ncbi:hypothetical protein ACET3Z_032849 [Daucus carota]
MTSNTQYAAPPRICDVCEDTVEGLFYWCQTCEFSVHPLCTQFPPSLRHAVHLSHPLMFQKSYKDAYCCVCNTAVCSYFWRYRCGCCDGFDVHVECAALLHIPHEQSSSDDTTSRRLPPWAGLYTYGGVSSAVNSQNMYHQTTPPYHMYNPYGGVSSMHNFYGHGMYAQQPHQFYGQMPHCAYPNMNSYYMYNPSIGLPYYTNPHNMYNGAPPCDLNSQPSQIHHGDTSHQGQAHNGQNSPAGAQKFGKMVFKIVANLTLGVMSNVIFGALGLAALSHFMHQGHALLQIHNTQDYLCGGCKTNGEATPRICDVCEDTVEGLFYWCEFCNFSVHPLCTQFPPSLRHVVHLSHPLVFQKSYDTTSRRLPPWAGLYTYGGVSSAVNSQNIYHQTTPPCHVYNPYGGEPSPHNLYGHGMYAQQPHQFYGQMPHYINPYYNMYNPSVGLPYYTNPHNMYNEAPPCDLNSQNGQIHHGDTGHQGPAHTAQNSPAKAQKFGKKVFKVLASLTLGVVSNVIFGALMIAL